jgi:hypothetical protein
MFNFGNFVIGHFLGQLEIRVIRNSDGVGDSRAFRTLLWWKGLCDALCLF